MECPAVGSNGCRYDVSLCGGDVDQLANVAVLFDLKYLTMVWTDNVESISCRDHAVECLIRFEISRLNMSGWMVHDELAQVCDLLPCPGITIYLDDRIGYIRIPVRASTTSKGSV